MKITLNMVYFPDISSLKAKMTGGTTRLFFDKSAIL